MTTDKLDLDEEIVVKTTEIMQKMVAIRGENIDGVYDQQITELKEQLDDVKVQTEYTY